MKPSRDIEVWQTTLACVMCIGRSNSESPIDLGAPWRTSIPSCLVRDPRSGYEAHHHRPKQRHRGSRGDDHRQAEVLGDQAEWRDGATDMGIANVRPELDIPLDEYRLAAPLTNRPLMVPWSARIASVLDDAH
jgi:hypothetical protein